MARLLFACWSAFDASLDPNSLPAPPAPGSTGVGASAATGAGAVAGGGTTRPGSAVAAAKADKAEREKAEKEKGADGSTALSGAGAMPAPPLPQPPAQLPPAPPPAVNVALALELQWALVHTLLGALEAHSRALAVTAGQRPSSAIAAAPATAPISTRPNTPTTTSTPTPMRERERERADSGAAPVFPIASQETPKESARQLSAGETAVAGQATNGSRTELTPALSLFAFASDEEHMISVDDFSDLVPVYEQLSDNWLILFRYALLAYKVIQYTYSYHSFEHSYFVTA